MDELICSTCRSRDFTENEEDGSYICNRCGEVAHVRKQCSNKPRFVRTKNMNMMKRWQFEIMVQPYPLYIVAKFNNQSRLIEKTKPDEESENKNNLLLEEEVPKVENLIEAMKFILKTEVYI